MADPPRAELISMCQRALGGEITLDEFCETRPAPADDFALAPLREVLEEGITHTPTYLFRRGVNRTAWQRSPEYSDLEFYLYRLTEEV